VAGQPEGAAARAFISLAQTLRERLG
jgi:hypothetical protein